MEISKIPAMETKTRAPLVNLARPDTQSTERFIGLPPLVTL
jgi:hypothetical protein